MRKLINKRAGYSVAQFKGRQPDEVKEWIPTGSRWLDSIICRGKLAFRLEDRRDCRTRSFRQVLHGCTDCSKRQKMGIDVVYFDSESAIDPTFLERAGCDLKIFFMFKLSRLSLY